MSCLPIQNVTVTAGHIESECSRGIFCLAFENGYRLTFVPHTADRKPAWGSGRDGPWTQMRMTQTGHGTNVSHWLMCSEEMGLQIQSVANQTRPEEN